MHGHPAWHRRRFLHSACSLTTGAVLACAAPEAPASIDIGNEVQLLLDDRVVAESKGLKRVLHRPHKQGLIREVDGGDWHRGDVYHGNIVCRDSRGRFHMTYRYMWSDPEVRKLHPSIGEDRAHWFRESIGYATSSNGIRWEK